MTKFSDAKNRADKLDKSFFRKLPTGGDDTTIMDAVIKALDDEELHLADPVTNPNSGKADFFAACDIALAGKFASATERAAFISDLWIATWASRKAQEFKPCW